jgi:hypothetical protein
MSTASQTCIVSILMVQCMSVQVLGSGERLSACWESTAELLLDTIIGALGAGGRSRGDGVRTGAGRRHIEGQTLGSEESYGE